MNYGLFGSQRLMVFFVCIVVSLMVYAPAVWAETTTALQWWQRLGLTQYDDLESFRWDDMITRGEIAKFFSVLSVHLWSWRLDAWSCSFADLAWYDQGLVPYIADVCRSWLMRGSGWNFLPDDPITWAEAITVLMRMKHGQQDETVSPWWKRYAYLWLYEHVLDVADMFALENPVSRSTVLQRMYRLAQPVTLSSSPDQEILHDTPQTDRFTVTRVVDGDTIIIDYHGVEERVRLIGINTPESVHTRIWVEQFGPEASQFTQELVEGNIVRIEFDEQQRDMYWRLLAYVWLDEIMLNVRLLEVWLAVVSTRPPNVRYLERFIEEERRAQLAWVWMRAPDYVPASDASPASASSSPPSSQPSAQSVNINTASLDELQRIQHINLERAEQIITLRPFGSVGELVRVRWIWDARVRDIITQWVALVE
jgi:endonuclease YncB( thermonuclease family)